MLDIGTIKMNGKSMVPDILRFTLYQGRRIDRSKHISIIEISSNNDNDSEDKVAKWQAIGVRVARESILRENL